MMQPSGNIFYKDEYDTFYVTVWETVGDVIDITSEVRIPYVWGELAQGFVRDGVLFRRGIITTTRQVIKLLNNGYEIVADGSSQIIDFIQMNYPCGPIPLDNFQSHFDNSAQDSVECLVTDGNKWSDADDDEPYIIWGDVDDLGTDVDITSPSLNMQWIDVWSA